MGGGRLGRRVFGIFEGWREEKVEIAGPSKPQVQLSSTAAPVGRYGVHTCKGTCKEYRNTSKGPERRAGIRVARAPGSTDGYISKQANLSDIKINVHVMHVCASYHVIKLRQLRQLRVHTRNMSHGF